MQLGSHVGVVVLKAGSCSSDSTPSLGTSICHRCGHKKKKKVNKQSPPKKNPKIRDRAEESGFRGFSGIDGICPEL